MKKIIFLAFIVCFFSAGTSFAETTFQNSGNDGDFDGVLDQYRTSAKVMLIAKGSNAAYNAVAGHLQGDWMYGSSGGDAVIYRQVKVAGVDVTAANVPEIPATASDTAGFAEDAKWEAL